MLIWIIHLIIIFGILHWFRPMGELKIYYWSGVGFKLLSGVVLGCIYFYYQKSGDTLFFHEKATELSNLPFQEYINYLFTANYPVFTGESRNDFFIKFLSIFYQCSLGSYWISGLYLSLISFTACWQFILAIRKYLPDIQIPAMIAFLYLPSAVLWSSGVFKDTIINSALFGLFSIALFYCRVSKISWAQILITTLCMGTLFYLKFYLFAVAGLCLSVLAIGQIIPLFSLRTSLKIPIMIGIGFILVFLTSQVNKNLNLDQLPQAIVSNYDQVSKQSEELDFTFHNLQPTYPSILINIPLSLFTGFFRPFIWEGSRFTFLFSLESLAIFILFWISVFKIRNTNISSLLLAAILFIFILACFLPLVSPNFGSLIRYRAAYMPLLSLLVMIIPYSRYFAKNRPFTY